MSSFLTLFDNGVPNLSVFSLPITLFIAALPHWYTIYVAESRKVQGGWTNENPRAFVARLNAKAALGKKLSNVEEMILRGQAAQQNGFEWFPVWAVAVVSAHSAAMPLDGSFPNATRVSFSPAPPCPDSWQHGQAAQGDTQQHDAHAPFPPPGLLLHLCHRRLPQRQLRADGRLSSEYYVRCSL